MSDAKPLRTRLFEVFEDADADPARIDQGALNIVIVGAGPTGVETAGAVADLVNHVHAASATTTSTSSRDEIYLVDHGPVVLGRVLRQGPRLRGREARAQLGVTLLLGTGVDGVAADRSC